MESEPWQRELADAVTDPRELLQMLDLSPADLPVLRQASAAFALRVPRYFVGLMQPGDPHDPLLAQVLPAAAELQSVPGFVADPVEDLAAARGDGILQKYRGRALLITTGACAVHCRYCFRRHFPYAEQPLLRRWPDALARLRESDDLREVILSGGDPLSLSDTRLADLVEGIAAIPQVERLRIHTRLPVVLPARVGDGLARLLAGTRLQTVCVIHANHPREITPELACAMDRLRSAGVALLNQSVLLKSVNDDADILAMLSEALFRVGVLPYYLHLLDPVAGAAHFEVGAGRAGTLLAQLRSALPGYLVPRLVREVPRADSKVPLDLLPPPEA